ncbi:unnamed protein product [Sphagnum jensenii]
MAERGLEDVEVQNGSRSSPLTNMQRGPKLVDLEKQDAAGVVTKQLQQQQTPVSLTWSNLSVTVSGRAGAVLHGQRARLLHNSIGYAEAGSITAIMGPSGSGKSTLLNAIAGRLSPNTVMTGKIMLNGQSKSTLAYGLAGYVTQEDVLIGTLTVRETIQYSARLRLPDKLSPKELKEIVDSTIVEMGLDDCQNTPVGTFFVRGISGGEKRLSSIALHILTRPHLLFLDEPTSAYFVVQTLKNLAKGGRTLISSIHQPSNEVFQLFDSLVLLSSGRTIFFGEQESAAEHFTTAGFPYPPLRNPSGHFLHTINADFDQVKSTLRNLTKLRRNPF